MSGVLLNLGRKGANSIFALTQSELQKAIETYGQDKEIGFGNTAYYLPLINALLNLEVKRLRDCKDVLIQAKRLLNSKAADNGLKLDILAGGLNLGLATLICEEILAAIFYLKHLHPQEGYVGFLPDSLLRSLGIQLVDGRIAGVAVILGCPKDKEAAQNIIRQLQSKNILSVLLGNIEGKSLKDVLLDEDVELGLEDYIVPEGKDYLSAIYAINWAIRASLTYGGFKSGQWKEILEYTKMRVPAFVLLLGYVDEVIVATGLGALALGFPIITDLDVPQIPKIETTVYEALVTERDYQKIVFRAIDVRGIKVKVRHLDLPVPYSAAFEGERVRGEQLYVEFGGKRSLTLEYLTSKNSEEIEDGRVEIIGPDIEQLEKDKKSMPLAIIVEVAGRKMQKDFESVLERQIHRYTNYAMGVMHIGQRDMCWIRINQQAYNQGFRLKHIGIFLHAMLHEEYAAIVDRIQVKLYTRQSDVEALRTYARKIYDQRDERIAGMTDESVDTFYSCLLCQSFAPNHVCIITPERLGLCGAYSWLDAKVCYEITPTGPNQPVIKGKILDEKLGQWQNVNDFVYEKSNKSVSKISMYSLMDSPQTSCVTGDTRIIIDNEVRSIGEFVDENRGGQTYAKSKALTLTKGKSVLERIVAMQRFELPKEKRNLIKVETKSGNEIILTPEHAIAIDRAEGLTWVASSQIKKGDRVVSLKNLEVREKVPDIYDLIPSGFRIKDKDLIRELKDSLSKKYGSLSKAIRELSLKYFLNNSLSISYLKIILKDLAKDYKEVIKSIENFYVSNSLIKISQQKINEDLFYLMGLIASDGSVFKRGNYKYNIYFINTRRELIDTYKKLYKALFPQTNLHISIKTPSKKSFIKGRKINSVRDCYVCYSNNPVFGILLDFFGIVPQKRKRNFKNLLSLPKKYITNFLTGLFDGDGSARLRRYKDIWHVAEGYLCTGAKQQAYYLGWLLKRFGILCNIRKSNSIYKIQIHGSNMYKFSKIINPVHKEKLKIIRRIRLLYAERKMDKTSRSVSDNIQKVIAQSDCKETRILKSLLNSDFYLDIVKNVKQTKVNRKYVYNLTLSETHCYFANQMFIKNCGCFECIVAIIPEVNGFMVVHRDYSGMTPCGMDFNTLAGLVGGGIQTPGFLGIGRLYIVSKKFILADGGFPRIVWMSRDLKEGLAEKLKQRCEEVGQPDLLDKIADETQAVSSEELLDFLTQVKHPALNMPALI